MESDADSPTKMHKRLVELMRASGPRTTLRVSQVATIIGVEGDVQYQQLRDQLARSRVVEYNAAEQTVRSRLDVRDTADDEDATAAPAVVSDGDVAGREGGARGLAATAELGVRRQHRSRSRHSYRGGGGGGGGSGYRSDTGLAATSRALPNLARRRAGGAWTKPGQRGLEETASALGPVGRVGYVCVADELHLGKLEAYYRAQGYYTKFDFDVLHVRFAQPAAVNVDAEGGVSSMAGLRDRERSRRVTASAAAAQRTGSTAAHSEDTNNSLPPPPLLRRAAAAGHGTPPAAGHGYGSTESSALVGSGAHGGDGGEAAAAGAAAAAAAGGACSGHGARHHFDLFVFPSGAVVWWGFDQRYFKIVENDYMLPHSAISHCMTNRYTTQLVNENYPVWCTFNLVQRDTLEVDDDFKARLRFDHFVIPFSRGEVATGSVLMLCASHALAQSAKIDYIELQVQALADSCSPLPRELRETGTVSVTERRLLQLRGEVLSYRLMLKSGSDLLDEPDFFWENSYLKPVFQATKEEYEISERVEALDNKLDAANEILSMLADDFSQRHGARLEWIVIWLVFVEVVIGVLELLVDVRPWFQSHPK
ncbi:YagE family protein [Novymonas esmeraldas]|uniref:YagE family protein n=1 Tax=Novymonas esmeraldas TaxID=1808958 RepID=A0AAW0ELY9_9TRYP